MGKSNTINKKTWLRYIIHSWSDISFFFGVFFAAVAIISGVLTVLATLQVSFDYFIEIKWLAVYLLAVHCVLFSFIALYYRSVYFNVIKFDEKSIIEENDSILANDLISSLKTALSAKKYLEVIRIGSALSRPFFVSGNYKARLNIGILVEEAAAFINDEKTQMTELIDSIGWMQVELGDLENGEKNIRHGLQYAQKQGDKFYISKANRHIGAINRRKEEYKIAEEFYEKSINIAEQIEDEMKKTEAIAATNYAQALLFFYTKDFSKANHFIEHSVEKFKELKMSEKIIMALTTKAQIYLAQGRIEEAKDLFRTSLHDAELRTLRLSMARCYIGLANVYIREKNWSKSKEYLDKSDETEKYIQTASEIAEIQQLRVFLIQKQTDAIP